MIFVVLHEVEHGGSQKFEDDADVAAIVEPIQHLHAQVLAFGILGVDLFEDIDLEFGSFAVLLHAFDDLDGDFGSLSARSAVMIHHLSHFAERTFAQMTNHFVSAVNEVTGVVDEMSVCVIGGWDGKTEQMRGEREVVGE